VRAASFQELTISRAPESPIKSYKTDNHFNTGINMNYFKIRSVNKKTNSPSQLATPRRAISKFLEKLNPKSSDRSRLICTPTFSNRAGPQGNNAIFHRSHNWTALNVNLTKS